MNDLVNQIAEGKANLLSADDICTRLSVSRSTFDRWVKNGTSIPSVGGIPKRSIFPRNDEDSGITFPQPDIKIGNSPRWSIETFKKWLSKNLINTTSA